MKKLLPFILVALPCYAQSYRIPFAHTNMIPVLQSENMATARNLLGIPSVASTNRVIVNTITDVATYQRQDGIPNVIETLGFAATGDRGAAVYVWRNTSSPTNIYRINAVGGGQWWEYDYLNGNVCNILKAGATPFDTTDDSVAIQRAFDAAAQQTQGSISAWGDEPIVYAPSGKYYVGQQTISYIASGGGSQGYGNIAFRGDGMYLTHFIVAGVPNYAMRTIFYFKGVMPDIRDFQIRSSSSSTPAYYSTYGIYLEDCSYGSVQNLSIRTLSIGMIVNSGAMNWMSIRNIQFVGNYVDVLGLGAQGTIGSWHSGSSHHTWYGKANSLILDMQYEGGGNANTLTPAALNILDGNDIDVRWGYNESSGDPAWLGMPQTNRVTLSTTDGVNITATLTEPHFILGTKTITVIAEQAVPEDIQNYIVGQRTTPASTSATNRFINFTAGGTVTNSLSGYTFLIVFDEPSYNVQNARLRIPGPTDAGKIIRVDKVYNVDIHTSRRWYVERTPRSRMVRVTASALASGEYPSNWMGTWMNEQAPINVFPDPALSTGTNWIGPSVSVWQNAALTPTNFNGKPGFLWYVANKPTGDFPAIRADFNPTIAFSNLEGRYVSFAVGLTALNHPAWVPTAFTINNGGTGYTNGLATVTHGGRTVSLNLTTTDGAITGVSWHFGAFVTNDASVANLPVVQGSASGGVVTPTAFANRSMSARINTDELQCRLMYRGENTSTLHAEGTTTSPSVIHRRSYIVTPDGHYFQYGITPRLGPINSSKNGFRFLILNTTLNPSYATGVEGYVITYMGVLLEPNQTDVRHAEHNWQLPSPWQYVTRYRAGIGYSVPYENGLATLFAGNDSGGRTGLRLINSLGTSGFVPYYLGEFASDPSSGMSAGAFYRNTSNNNFRFYTGTTWVDF